MKYPFTSSREFIGMDANSPGMIVIGTIADFDAGIEIGGTRMSRTELSRTIARIILSDKDWMEFYGMIQNRINEIREA